MPRVLVIGRRDAILPFRAAGVELVEAEDASAAVAMLRELHETLEQGLVLVPEEWAAQCAPAMALLRQSRTVAVIAVPFASGSTGLVRERVRQLVTQSLGVDLMGKSDRDTR